jgi:hypothetical protein
MRNHKLISLKQMVRSLLSITLMIFLASSLLLNSAISQTIEEQQWWFNVELIAFKRTLQPSNNEDFTKADFVTTQTHSIDLLSLNLLKQLHPLEFYIDQLASCKQDDTDTEALLASEIGASDINTEDSVVTDSSPNNAIKETNVPLQERIEPTLNGTHLPPLYSFETKDGALIKFLCLAPRHNGDKHSEALARKANDDKTLSDSASIKIASATNLSALQMLDEIPARLFINDSTFNYKHTLLSPADLRLEDYASKVLRQRDIQPLIYTAWRQQVVFGEENADFYRIKAGKKLTLSQPFNYQQALLRYNNEKKQEIETSEQQSQPAFFQALSQALESKEEVDWLAQQPIIESDMPAQDVQASHFAPWELNGLLKVYLDYVNQVPYLHIDTEFKHYKVRIDANGQGTIDTYPLKQRRRIISQQIHYFDHPGFGIIIRLERFTPPSPEALVSQDLAPST